MNKKTFIPPEWTVHDLPRRKCKVLVHRARELSRWRDMLESVRKFGLKRPIAAVDITSWPRDKRLNNDGHVSDWGIIKGEGRLMIAEELSWSTIPSFIREVEMAEIIGLHWSENNDRKDMSWAQKGWLIRAELKFGTKLEDAAEDFGITPGLARRYMAVLDKAVSSEVLDLPMNQAEKLVMLPARGQKVVIDLAKDVETPIHDIIAEAETLEETENEWTKGELQKALTKYKRQYESTMEELEAMRVHDGLGPQNFELLLLNPKYRAACDRNGINYQPAIAALKIKL